MASTTQPELEERWRFPAVVIYDDAVTAYETSDNFVLCRTMDIRAGQRGRFARSRLVDSTGRLWHLDGAKVANGVGPLWGWRLFSRCVRASPVVVRGPEPADLGSIRQDLIRLVRFRASFVVVVRSFCATMSGREVSRLIPRLESAATVSDLVFVLLGGDFPERERILR